MMLWSHCWFAMLAVAHAVERRQDATSVVEVSDTPTAVASSAPDIITATTEAPPVTVTEDPATSPPTDSVVTVTDPIVTDPPVTSPSTDSPPPASSTPGDSQTTAYTPSTDPDTVTVTWTAALVGQASTTTTVYTTSTVTVLVTSTNFITSTITSSNVDTATATRYVTVTSFAKRGEHAQPTRRARFGGLDAPARRADAVTVTETVTQTDDLVATVSEVVVETTSSLTTVDVPVTTVVYLDARTTITVDSTLTVTSTPVTLGTLTMTSTAAPTTIFPTNPATTPSATSSPAAGGLSTAAKAGIGAGAGAVVILLAVLIVVFILRKKRGAGRGPFSPSGPAVSQHQHPHSHFNNDGLAAHHANLDGRQPTIPDEAAILGTVPRKSVVFAKVGEMGASPPPRYESAPLGDVNELADEGIPGRYGRAGQGQGHTRAWSEPEPGRPELDSRATGAGRWSTPAHVQTDAGVVDNTGRFTFGSGEHGRYSAAEWGPKQPEELEAQQHG